MIIINQSTQSNNTSSLQQISKKQTKKKFIANLQINLEDGKASGSECDEEEDETVCTSEQNRYQQPCHEELLCEAGQDIPLHHHLPREEHPLLHHLLLLPAWRRICLGHGLWSSSVWRLLAGHEVLQGLWGGEGLKGVRLGYSCSEGGL